MYGLTMAVGTLVLLDQARPNGPTYAATLAFTTFVLFQLFNVFNARIEHASAFNRQIFNNAKLWAALSVVLGLQVWVVHWSPAQNIFHTTALSAQDWALAFAVASSILLLDEGRKWLLKLFRAQRNRPI